MKKILIIEDEKILSEMYRLKFEKEGYQVFSAIDVDEGVKITKEASPNLIILDILLPKENGLSFLEKIKDQKEITTNIPVVVMSNFDDKETRERALALGIKEYIIKSNYDPNEILKKVKAYLD
ncbi:MAG TPA: response regulator [Candidatus Pacearchaeota archaeon]|jgi:DNA-binding response OmpR family regulator|nr:response regulator [Candidatus Pacearchaeota archaeon]HQG09375.1 response regulator [Candidatus Pacearchaeota archaeon]HQH19978.1 response regulator [Candidatus Pacearchaeota archaeon]HQK58562.1 response regulator [Candidatus Pacearchaeota archaeon]